MHGYPQLPGQFQHGQFGVHPGMPILNSGIPVPPPLPPARTAPISSTQATNNSVSKQLDNLIANTKWMQCTSLIDSWVKQAAHVMENGHQLEPYAPFESTISESGTELSHAQTAPFDESVQNCCLETVEIPVSPPWRSVSEGGEIAIPPLQNGSNSGSAPKTCPDGRVSRSNNTKDSQDSAAMLASLGNLSVSNPKMPEHGGDEPRTSRAPAEPIARKSHSQAATADSAEKLADPKGEARPESKQVRHPAFRALERA